MHSLWTIQSVTNLHMIHTTTLTLKLRFAERRAVASDYDEFSLARPERFEG